MAYDASPYGLGAVLSHQLGSDEQPTALASHSLAPAEKNYSQIGKETLAIVFGVKHFAITCLGENLLSNLTTSHYNICLVKREAFQLWLLQGHSIGHSP